MLGRDRIGPLLDSRTGDLNCRAAGSAHKVMMMLAAAHAVDALALVIRELINLARLGQGLKCAVDGGQPDRGAAMAQIVMKLLCGTKIIDLSKQFGHCSALPGLALRDAHACSLLRRRIGTAMIASTAKQARAMMTMAGPGGAST